MGHVVFRQSIQDWSHSFCYDFSYDFKYLTESSFRFKSVGAAKPAALGVRGNQHMGMNCEASATSMKRIRVETESLREWSSYRNIRTCTARRWHASFVVMNSEMAPRYEVGNVAYLDSNLTPQTGDDVLLTPAAGTAITRRLDRETKSSWHVTQFNPEGCSVLKKSHWPILKSSAEKLPVETAVKRVQRRPRPTVGAVCFKAHKTGAHALNDGGHLRSGRAGITQQRA